MRLGVLLILSELLFFAVYGVSGEMFFDFGNEVLVDFCISFGDNSLVVFVARDIVFGEIMAHDFASF